MVSDVDGELNLGNDVTEIEVTHGMRLPNPRLPRGTVTFLFTDIESSTIHLQKLGDARYSAVQADHRRILRSSFTQGGGVEVDTQGDAFFYAFEQATAAVNAAAAAQQAILSHPWPEGMAMRVRMGLHTGEAVLGSEGYVGLDVVRGSRIMSAGHGGQVLLTETTAELVQQALPESVALRDLGEHRLKDLARAEHIFQLVIAGLPSDFPLLKSLGLHHNLPSSLTSFIGREREAAQVKELLASTSLVTLTGAGGSGKTRLALEVAADLLNEFPGGVWLVELASLSDPGLVVQAVASTLGVREIPGRSLLDSLIDYVQAKTLLLVLDNCEHLITACAQLAETLLRAAPKLRILATSRETLGIQGEATYRVPSLTFPDFTTLPPVDQLIQYEAIQLFVARAVSCQPGFELTEANVNSVAQIVRHLDGIPLAIELAAARMKLLSVEQIAQRLGDRFRLLTGGSRTALPRHQTLRAAIDWSYELLSEAERTVLRRLAVFAGGFTLEAVEAICAGDGVEADWTLDLVMHLVDKSLVLVVATDGEARYKMLETIREYSRGKLFESGEDAAVRRRYLDWYRDFVKSAETELRGPQQLLWLGRLDAEHDNLRAALDASLSAETAESGLHLAGALHHFWVLRGYLSEGRDWLEGILTWSNGASKLARSQALYGAGVLAFHQGDYARSTALCEESLALCKECGIEPGIALTLTALGNVARSQGDYARASRLFEESLALWREVGDKWGLANVLTQFGTVARSQGDYARARGLFEESLLLWREVGDRWGLATSLAHLGLTNGNQGDYERASALHEESLALRRELGDKVNMGSSLLSLGTVALNLGDYERARELFEESLALRREIGDKVNIAASLGNLGIVAYYQGDYERAVALLQESLELWRKLGAEPGLATALNVLGRVIHAQGDEVHADELFQQSLSLYAKLGERRGLAWSLEGLARVAAAKDRPERAARLFGTAEMLRETIGDPLPPRDREDYDRGVRAARARLGDQRFAAEWARGRAMTIQEAIEEAVQREQ